jgi:hypothetical protein
MVLKEINGIEKNNIEMRKIFTQQIIENKRADGEIKTEGMNSLMKENGDRQKSVKVQLNIMKKDIDVGKAGALKDEPEQRIKVMMHKTMTTKFRDTLRAS